VERWRRIATTTTTPPLKGEGWWWRGRAGRARAPFASPRRGQESGIIESVSGLSWTAHRTKLDQSISLAETKKGSQRCLTASKFIKSGPRGTSPAVESRVKVAS
jgi:hypothetical protein